MGKKKKAMHAWLLPLDFLTRSDICSEWGRVSDRGTLPPVFRNFRSVPVVLFTLGVRSQRVPPPALVYCASTTFLHFPSVHAYRACG